MYEHYLRPFYDFASELYLRKALRPSFKMFCEWDVYRNSILTLALSYDNRKTVVRYFVNRDPGLIQWWRECFVCVRLSACYTVVCL